MLFEDLHGLATEQVVIDAIDFGERALAEETLDRVSAANYVTLSQ
jgi:hypothetical protein